MTTSRDGAEAPKDAPPKSKRVRPPIVFPAPKGWRSRSILHVGIVFAALSLIVGLLSGVSALRPFSVHLSTHPSWTVRELRDVESVRGNLAACYVPLPSGRLVQKSQGAINVEREILPSKPWTPVDTPRDDRRALTKEAEAVEEELMGSNDLFFGEKEKKDKKISIPGIIRGRCFELSATGRLVDVGNRVELTDFGHIAETSGGTYNALLLLALFCLCGIIPIFLTTRTTWSVALISSMGAATLQGTIWMSQIGWGSNGVLTKPTQLGAAAIPTGVFILFFLLALIAFTTITNALVTTMSFAVGGAMSCRACQAVFTNESEPHECPSCRKALPKTRIRPLVALGAAMLSGVLLVGLVLAPGAPLGYLKRCDAGDPGGVCAYFVRQHPGLSVTDLGGTIVVYDKILYLLIPMIAFFPAPFAVARFLPSGRSTAALAAALAWFPAAIGGAFLLSPSSDLSVIGSYVIFHMRALFPWIIPGLVGAFAGYALRMRQAARFQDDLSLE